MNPIWTFPCAAAGAVLLGLPSAQLPTDAPVGVGRPVSIPLAGAAAAEFYVLSPGADDVYLRHDGQGQLVDVTTAVGLAGMRSRSVAEADFDGDGLVDLLRVGVDGSLSLHQRTTEETFEDVTAPFGLADVQALSARWTDLDVDGSVDLAVDAPTGLRFFRSRDGLFEELEVPLPAWRAPSGGGAPSIEVIEAEEPVDGRADGASDRIGTHRLSSGNRPGGSGRVPIGTRSAAAGGPGAPAPEVSCIGRVRDQATGNCIVASSIPAMDALYPLSDDFNLSPATGFVGMGTSTPSHRLTVAGTIRSFENIHANYGTSSNPTFRFGGGTEETGLSSPNFNEVAVVTDAVERIRIDDQGFVGIGTDDPSHKLVVSDPGDVALVLDGDSDTAGSFDHPVLRLQQNGGNVEFNLTFREGSHDLLLESPDGFEQHFKIFDNANPNDWEFQNFSDVEARITDLGDLQIDGNVSSPATDLAEYYPLVETVEPGDVVAFAGNGLELVRGDAQSGQRLAGIVSSKPGLLLGISSTNEDSDAVAPPPIADDERYLGEEHELLIDRLVQHEIEVNGRAPLALAGRVPCKVSDENGPIRPGDLLTVSSTPGHAMKAVAPGPVIGTALQSFEAGQGRIVVLANLGWFSPASDVDVAELEREVDALRADLRALASRVEDGR